MNVNVISDITKGFMIFDTLCLREFDKMKLCIAFSIFTTVLLCAALPFEFDSLEKALKDLDTNLILEKHGHSIEQELDKHGHSFEDHDLEKRTVEDGEEEREEEEREEREIEALINEVEGKDGPSGERVCNIQSMGPLVKK